MAIERISGASDARIAPYCGISDAALLKTHGLFVAEGRLVVRRVIEARTAAVQSVLVSDAAYRSLRPHLASLPDRVPIFICAAGDFLGITEHHLHRGCLALVERPPAVSAGDLLAAAVEPSGKAAPLPTTARRAAEETCIVVVLEGVTNADNVGGVFRNAAAFGARGVLLDPASCDPLYRKSIRTSMAAVLSVPFARVDPWPEGLSALRGLGFTIAALTPREPAVALDAFAASGPSRVALLVGTEGEGLSREAESAADCRVKIPIAPEVDSLNLAVAVGIALYRLQCP